MSEQQPEISRQNIKDEARTIWEAAIAAHQQLRELTPQILAIVENDQRLLITMTDAIMLGLGKIAVSTSNQDSDRILRAFSKAVIEYNACVDFAAMLADDTLLEAILGLEGSRLDGTSIPDRDDPNEPEAR